MDTLALLVGDRISSDITSMPPTMLMALRYLDDIFADIGYSVTHGLTKFWPDDAKRQAERDTKLLLPYLLKSSIAL